MDRPKTTASVRRIRRPKCQPSLTVVVFQPVRLVLCQVLVGWNIEPSRMVLLERELYGPFRRLIFAFFRVPSVLSQPVVVLINDLSPFDKHCNHNHKRRVRAV